MEDVDEIQEKLIETCTTFQTYNIVTVEYVVFTPPSLTSLSSTHVRVRTPRLLHLFADHLKEIARHVFYSTLFYIKYFQFLFLFLNDCCLSALKDMCTFCPVHVPTTQTTNKLIPYCFSTLLHINELLTSCACLAFWGIIFFSWQQKVVSAFKMLKPLTHLSSHCACSNDSHFALHSYLVMHM